MSGLSEIQLLIEETLAFMRGDPQHTVSPFRRYAIYRKMNSTIHNPPALNLRRGKLGLLTAQYVLPIWQRITPIWSYSEEEIQKWNLLPEDLEQFRSMPDNNVLPERLIEMTNGLLEGTISVDVAMQRINTEHIWDTVGAMVLEFFQIRNDLPLVACHACEAAVRALYESLGYESFSNLSKLENFTDDNLPDHFRDTASHAMIAYAGGTAKEPVDFNRRQEFWEWWLTEAIPMACSP